MDEDENPNKPHLMDDGDDSYEYENDSSSESSSGSVACTGIIMVSPPESSEVDEAHNNRASQDVFQTPPEYSYPPTSEGKTPLLEVNTSDDDPPYEDVGDGRGVIVAFGEGTGAVDLGGDTDLGFAEAAAVEFRVLRRELSPEGGLLEPPLKKLKDSEQNLGKFEPSCSSTESLEIDGCDESSGEEGSEERKLDSSDNESESAVEETQSNSDEKDSVVEMEDGGEECLGDVMSTPNVTIEELRRIDSPWQGRALPRSIMQPGSSAMDGEDTVQNEVAILDVLKLLKDKYDGDGDDVVDNGSFWEISKSRGMTFPRPLWWPEGGF